MWTRKLNLKSKNRYSRLQPFYHKTHLLLRPFGLFERLEDRLLLTAEIEPNNALANATAFVRLNDTLTGRINDLNDVDYWAISLSVGETLRFRFGDNDFDSSPAFGPSMEILNAAGAIKASSLDSHSFAFTVAATGTYVLRLTASNVFGYFTDAYSIAATVDAFSGTAETESNNNSATANALPGESNFRGSLATSSDVDRAAISAGSMCPSATATRTARSMAAATPASFEGKRLQSASTAGWRRELAFIGFTLTNGRTPVWRGVQEELA